MYIYTYAHVRTYVGLCSWAINIVKFYEVYCDVEPKRKALEQANSDLAAAQDKLSKIKAKIKVSITSIALPHRPSPLASLVGVVNLT